MSWPQNLTLHWTAERKTSILDKTDHSESQRAQHQFILAPCSPTRKMTNTRNAELKEKGEQRRREESFINLSTYKHNDCFIDKLCLSYNEVINLMKIYQEKCVETDNDTIPHH